MNQQILSDEKDPNPECAAWQAPFGGQWPVRIIAGITLLNGLLSIFQALERLRRFPGIFNLILPFGVHYWTRSLTLLFGIALVYLAFNLFGQKRVAFWLTLISTALIGIIDLMHIHRWYLAIPSIAALILLVVFRRRFFVKSEPSGIARGILIFAAGMVVAVAYGVIGFWLIEKRDFGMTFSVWSALERTLRQFVLIGNADLVPATRFARWFLTSLSITGPLSFALGLFSIFQPVAYRLSTHPKETAEALQLLREYGSGSYDYFKVWGDKSYYFSDSRRSFISYRTARGVAVCLGDPIGPPEELPQLIESFLRYCRANAWLAVFMVLERPETYKELCLTTLQVGEEAIIDLDRFAAATSSSKYFRYAARTLEGSRFKAKMYVPPLPSAKLDEIEGVTARWLTLAQHREFGFYQGTFSRAYVDKNPVFVVEDAGGRVVAFINQVPSYKKGEATFDMMRHLPGTHKATMDYLFRFMMLTLQGQGFHTFDMGMVPFLSMDLPDKTRLGQRAMSELGVLTNRLVHSEGLRGYKLKFEPSWEPRYIAYTGSPVGLARIGLAAMRVL
jgi:phosphatidylglycerol lysyltransferase